MVTGASRGIGAAAARALDSAGARVALVARSGTQLLEVAGELDHDPVVLLGDLAEVAAPLVIERQALDALGSVDVLVNNAAAAVRLDAVDTDAAIIDEMLAVNVRAPLLLFASLVSSMIEAGRGSINWIRPRCCNGRCRGALTDVFAVFLIGGFSVVDPVGDTKRHPRGPPTLTKRFPNWSCRGSLRTL